MRTLISIITVIGSICLSVVEGDSIDNVNVFFGADGAGHVFPGSTRPFGMVKMGIDAIDSSFGDAYSGYAPGGIINGISMMHESGTGGAPEYGVVSQLPLVSEIDYTTESYIERSEADVGIVGKYTVKTTDNTTIEFAGAERSGIYKYTFPDGATPQIMINASHHLAAPSRPWWTQYFVNGSIEASENKYGYTGYTTIKGGWGLQAPWTIYFCGDFKTPSNKVISFTDSNAEEGSSAFADLQNSSIGLVFEFQNETEIYSRVGVSFISTDQACENINQELGEDYDLKGTVEATQNKWRSEVFDKVNFKTDNDTIRNWLVDSLYGAHLLPSNRTGENPNWDSSEPYYDDFFTLWDTFRCLNPMINILNPTRGAEIIRSFTAIYENEGFTPDGRSANQNGRTQGGSNSDIVMADAYIKNINEGVNWNSAYAAMVKNAEVQPPYWYDSYAPDASTKDGRGALPDWLKYGWVTRNYTRSVTRTMEYAYDDYALSVVAKGLGKNSDHKKYLARSANWQNIWNFAATAEGYNYTGFIQPKNADGSFNYTDYDPMSCGGCYWGDDEYEGKPVEYGWAVPHDVETLKSFIGSELTFLRRLDDMFGLHGQDTDGVADIGNEPSFLTPYLYNYVNAQYRTVETIKYLVNSKYSSTLLPGNSDAGAMQAWLFFALIGLYPVAATPTYLLSSPFLPYVAITLANGKKVEITAKNLSEDNIYVKSVTVNGKNWNKNWISHEDVFVNGGKIVFDLTNEKTIWESGDIPPSPGHYTLVNSRNYNTTKT
ncbi:uncharacterized protein PRCAT00000856001 [Priceomyces carsonii]|uniref:uncharacterized protein n=1 Tax=Priceomyces carsonii TaxID=28549 RepID=UPI002ED9E6C4|nr:unnamed protein product [Priceomyces carsonii]